MQIQGPYKAPEAGNATAQNVTSNWADLGSEIRTEGYSKLGLYLNVDINDSANIRIRALAKRESAGTDEYCLPIETVSSSDVKIEDEYMEFNVDADQKVILSVQLDRLIPWVQIQVQAGTVGQTAGQIDSFYYSLGNQS